MRHVPAISMALAVLCVVVIAQDGGKPVAPPEAGRVVLRVNAQEITRTGFEEALLRHRGREFMEELVDWLLIRRAADSEKVSITDEEVEERHDDMLMKQLGMFDHDIEKLQEYLKLFGYTIAQRKKAMVFRTRLMLLAQKVIRKERTTEENLKREFEQRYPETIGRVAKVYHIHISTAGIRDEAEKRISYLKYRHQIASEKQKEEISKELAGLKEKLEKWKGLSSRKVADEIVRKLRDGAGFAKIAAEYGASYTSEFYDMGWTTKQVLNKLLVPAVFEQLKPGEIGEPIQSQWGFHVLKLVDIKDVSELKYEEARPYLLNELGSMPVGDNEVADFFLKLRREAVIERPGLPLTEESAGEPGK